MGKKEEKTTSSSTSTPSKPSIPPRIITNETSYEIRGSVEVPTNNDRPRPTEKK